MMNADNEERKRRSSLKTSVLDTIAEGKQQISAHLHLQQQKVMKSKGVQVSRPFEDSLRRYNRVTTQRSEFFIF